MHKRKRSDHELAEEIANKLKRPPPAAEARLWLQRAFDAGDGSLRQAYLQQAQRAIANLNPARQGRLIQQLQGHVLAMQGRGRDTEIAHVTPGEVVIPVTLQTPELRASLIAAARANGIDPASLFIGSGRNAVNPRTRRPKFDIEELEDQASQVTPPAIAPTNNLRDMADRIVQHIDNNPTPPPLPQDIETVTVTGRRLPQPTPAEQTLLGRMIFTEGAGDYRQPGLFQGLGSTALNRQGAANYGTSMSGIINQSKQFEGVGSISSNSDKPTLWQQWANPDQLTGANRQAYAQAQTVAKGLVDGTLSDNTGGATRFGSGPGNGIMPRRMQEDVDSGSYERSRPDIGNWAFLRPKR